VVFAKSGCTVGHPARRRRPISSAPHPPRPRPAALAALVLGLLLVAAVLTQAPPRERLPHFVEHTPANIAHAGAQGHAPGNTLEAFELALEMGADTLEMDAQITADGDLVLHHDGTVDRQTDGAGAVAEMTVPELQALDAGHTFAGDAGDFPWRGQGVVIPTLDEVFEAFPDTQMIIEMKLDGGPAIVEALAAAIDAHRRHDSVVVASFDLDYLHRFRTLQPDIPTNMPEDETRAFYTRQLVGLDRWWRPPAELFQVPEVHEGRRVVTERFVTAADRLGVDVHVWTVNEPEDMRRLVDLGVHGIITDYPDRLAEVISGTGIETATEADPDSHTFGLGLTRWMQDNLGFLTPVMLAITHLGDEEFYIVVFPLLYWSVHRAIGLRVGILLLLSAGLNAALKLGFRSPRPSFLDPDLGLVSESTFGIPSGHAQNAVAVWGLLAAELARRWAWAAGLALIALLGLSRIHLGVHLPEDVLIGWAVGAVLLVAFLRLRGPVGAWLGGRSPGGQVLVAFGAAVGLIGLAGTLRAQLVGYEFPAAWIGTGDAALEGGALGVAGAVNPAAALFGLALGVVLLRGRGGFDTAGSVPQRLLRFPLGLLGVIVLWQGLGAVLPGGEDPVALLFRFVRYALLGLWIGGLAPMLFVRLGLAPPAGSRPSVTPSPDERQPAAD
jgi:glycerophosphoryl diester phosphodiesterase/membrane-associated phospholipid phosphatase